MVRKAKGEVAAGALRATEHVAKDSESRADESAMARARCGCGMKVESSTTKGCRAKDQSLVVTRRCLRWRQALAAAAADQMADVQ